MADWQAYYQALQNRAPRAFFLEALSYVSVGGEQAHAIDLGFGDGAETQHLLQLGWHVQAIDKEAGAARQLLSRLEPSLRQRLKLQISSFERASLAPADFIYAGLSLPYVAENAFALVWEKLRCSLKPQGYLAAQFFGQHYESKEENMTLHHKQDLLELLKTFDIRLLRELREDAETALGHSRHWHYFEVIAVKK